MVDAKVKSKSKPYISFVTVGRNDNYGHRFLERFQNFVNNLAFLCDRHGLNSELIVLDWNPPLEEKRLNEVLKLPKSENLTYRFIEVSKKIHDSFANEKNAPLLEYPGKNVGIKRALGDFVLITNPDIVFSDEVIKFLSEKKLEKGVLYRTSRFDLSFDVPDDLRGDKLLNFCEKNWDLKWSMNFGRYPRGLKRILYVPRMMARYFFPFIFEKYLPYKYHGGMPGDFMLMHKDDWNKIGGFPENGWTCVLDFYGVIFSVVKLGKMKELPYKIYHQYHKFKGPRAADFNQYIDESVSMLKTGKLIQNNIGSWGLRGKKLKEIKIGKK